MYASRFVVLVHRGQHGRRRERRRHVVAHMHRNVAHHAIERRADGVVVQQLFLGFARFHRRLVIRLGVLERPAAPVRKRRGWSRRLQTASAGGPTRSCRSRRAPSSAARWRAAESTVACCWRGSIVISTWPVFTWSPEWTLISVSSPLTCGINAVERRDLMVATYSLLWATGAMATVAVCTGRPCGPDPAAAGRLFLAARCRQHGQGQTTH